MLLIFTQLLKLLGRLVTARVSLGLGNVYCAIFMRVCIKLTRKKSSWSRIVSLELQRF